VLPAALSEDRTAALYDDGSAALVGDHLHGSLAATADSEPSLTVAVALTHLVDGTFMRHSGGLLATVLTDLGCAARSRLRLMARPTQIHQF
jgi:hypothetical protein